MSKEAMKLALEALKYMDGYYISLPQQGMQAIKALEEALAKQEQGEPVGQLLEDAFGRGQVMWFNKPKDESMLYTTPQQRTWVGLTDREKSNLWLESRAAIPRFHTYATLVEAKLKEKNT